MAMVLHRTQEQDLVDFEKPTHKRSKLRVKTFFAAEDSLIGDRGAAWFESLWTGQENWVDYQSESKDRLGHDEIPTRKSGCMDWIMGEIARTWEIVPDPQMVWEDQQTKLIWNYGW